MLSIIGAQSGTANIFKSVPENTPAGPRPSADEFYQSHSGGLDADHQNRLKQALVEHQTRAAGPYLDVQQYNADQQAYYGDLAQQFKSMDGQALYHSLSDKVITTHIHDLPYDPSQYLYPWVDVHPEGDLESIYTHQKADPQEAILADLMAHQASLQAPETAYALAATQPQYNCEHVVPQSWFGKRLPMRGDLHHLFACDVNSNSKRGNLKYADLPGNPVNDGTVDNANHEFEPGGGKGAVARATLYFLLRYPGEVGDAASEYHQQDIQTLVAWAKEFPITDYEKHRNEEIFKLQGNRNPLIDFPDLVDKIDFTLGLGHGEQLAQAA